MTTQTMPGSPWVNGYCESFKSKMRDEVLNLEIFDTMFNVKKTKEG
jgi:hypothetical protein